ncbi:MAG: S8 family serine peptidase, partial [Ignavibacteria bacterium]|nr:S8 family serine peptidase [Ignavibacteria bacterium]
MKTKIRFIKYCLILFLATSVFFAFKNPGNKISVNSNKYFKLPDNLTENDYVPKTIIIKLKERNRINSSINSIDNISVNEVLNDLNTVSINKIFTNAIKPVLRFSADGEKLADLSLIYIFEYNSSKSIEEAVNEIYNTGEVEYAQPKYTQKLMFTPNDPFLGSQYFINKIQAPAGWDIQQGDTNVVIGIVDSGTDWDHPDLEGNIKYNYSDPINGTDDDNDGYTDNYRGWDLGDRDNDPMVSPDDDHGSFVSGCADAVTNNGTGVSSPGFKCKFLPVKISNSAGLAAGYEGIVYAADHGCSIINCSWGGGYAGEFEQEIINYVSINKNALVICAAGNYNSSETFYPADLKYVISVASTNSSDIRSSYSNYGNGIDVCSPGEGIRSTLYNNSYSIESGTSFSSPVCAGVCAIVKSQFPSYTGLQAGEKVRVTCDNIDLQNPSYIGKLGKGRINMLRALTISSPSVRINSYTAIDGNNNVFQPNDTISITGIFKNYLDATSNAIVTISSTSTAVSILNGNSTLGVIPTLGTVTNNSSPFRVIVNNIAPVNSKVFFKVNYSDGSYTDFEYFSITINPTYLSINGNNITTTLNGKGNIGYN